MKNQFAYKLLGMKLVDSVLPKTEWEPEWSYEGLKEFFSNHSIDSSCAIEEVLKELNAKI